MIYHGYFEDETAPSATWFVPASHELEMWGDVASADGVISVVQPLIAPLFTSISRSELLAPFVGPRQTSYELVKELWKKSPQGSKNFGTWWDAAVQKGILASADPAGNVSKAINWDGVAAAASAATLPKADGIEINFVTDSRVYDGRYADNAWLQELPDPMSKVCWGNTLVIGPALAKRLNLPFADDRVEVDRVEVVIGNGTVATPVYVMPGQADNTATLSLGFGRTGSEVIAEKTGGANAYRLRTSTTPWFADAGTINILGISEKLSITQEHWDMDERPIALDLTAAEWKNFEAESTEAQKQDPEQARKEHVHLPILKSQQGESESLYEPMLGGGQDPQYAWAMSIDMSKCTGCNACVIACESENNILVVGKEQVRRGREMSWLRLDRYFSGDMENPEIVTQPVMCVHCENAPCEYVCPVNATMHDEEGLNVMVYNRCIGTRYCSNNCPYKARRFNFLNYHFNLQGTEEMAMNPNVTVRARGIMEKCTYCIQRIESARITSRVEKREIKDGEVITACTQTCPSEAITFGSLHNKENKVAKSHEDKRAYQLLKDLNTRPRTLHLAKVRNPQPGVRVNGRV